MVFPRIEFHYILLSESSSAKVNIGGEQLRPESVRASIGSDDDFSKLIERWRKFSIFLLFLCGINNPIELDSVHISQRERQAILRRFDIGEIRRSSLATWKNTKMGLFGASGGLEPEIGNWNGNYKSRQMSQIYTMEFHQFHIKRERYDISIAQIDHKSVIGLRVAKFNWSDSRLTTLSRWKNRQKSIESEWLSATWRLVAMEWSETLEFHR